MGAKNSTPKETGPNLTPDFTVSSGFITGILVTIIFLTLSWFIGTRNEKASAFYQSMMCDFIVG